MVISDQLPVLFRACRRMGRFPFTDSLWLHCMFFSVLSLLMTVANGVPARFNASEYAAIHPRLPKIIKERISGKHCGNWYVPYSQMQAAVRADGAQPNPQDQQRQQQIVRRLRRALQQQDQHQQQQLPNPDPDAIGYWSISNSSPASQAPPPARYAVMQSMYSGLGDRLGCTLSVFLYAVLTNRVFEYMWYGHHVLWDTYQSFWIDWRVPAEDPNREATVRGDDGSVLPVVTENHHWRQPNRSRHIAHYYLNDPQHDVDKRQLKNMFASENVMDFGHDKDIVFWTLNSGLLVLGFHNPKLTNRLQELGLTWEHAVPCLFNYLFVPTPEALAPFRRGELLEKLLDPNNFVIGIQIRLGDWVFNSAGNGGELFYGNGHFTCAQQLTDEVERAYAEAGMVAQPSTTTTTTAAGASGTQASQATSLWSSSSAAASGSSSSEAVLPATTSSTLTFQQQQQQRAAQTSSTHHQWAQSWVSKWFSAGGRRMQQQPDQLQQPQQQQQQGDAATTTPVRKKVYWFLISDSASLRRAAVQKYGGDGRLLVAEDVPLDHVQDFPRHKQLGLHVAGGEVWLFGQASAHVITTNSAFGRLGALAGGPRPGLGLSPDEQPAYRIYGMASGGYRHQCSLSNPDSLDTISSWWIGLRRA